METTPAEPRIIRMSCRGTSGSASDEPARPSASSPKPRAAIPSFSLAAATAKAPEGPTPPLHPPPLSAPT
eukprot:12159925-Prorocentrum_lima.AAC.1